MWDAMLVFQKGATWMLGGALHSGRDIDMVVFALESEHGGHLARVAAFLGMPSGN